MGTMTVRFGMMTARRAMWHALAAAACLALAAFVSVRTEGAGLRVPAPGAAGELQGKAGAKRKVVFVAGRRSHAYGSHDHWAGSLLLSRWLNDHAQIEAVVLRDGWPADPAAFDGAAAVVVYADGGRNHPVVGHLD